MAKLHFYYGVMSSSKSALLCINAYNLRRTDNKFEVIKPSIDNRDSTSKIVSRIGLSTDARALPNLDIYKPKRGTQFILVDEVQFFSPKDKFCPSPYPSSSQILLLSDLILQSDILSLR